MDAAFAPCPAPRQLLRLRFWLRQVRELAARRTGARPFLIVTPLGLLDAEELARGLIERSIHVVRREALPNWPAISTALYVHRDDDASLLKALAFEQAWDSLFPNGAAECWLLESMTDFGELVHCKKELRAILSSQRVRLVLPEESLVGRLHPFHSPDPEQLSEEWGCLEVVRGGSLFRAN